MKTKFLKIWMGIAIPAFVMSFSFQNCSPAKFDSAKAQPSKIVDLGTQGDGLPVPPVAPPPGSEPEFEATPTPPPSPDPQPTPGSQPTPPPVGPTPPVVPPPVVPPTTPPAPPVMPTPRSNGGASAEIVECQIKSPRNKVAADGEAIVGRSSNRASSRVCMSRNACLSLVNSYAAARNCALAKGAPTSNDTSAQCTGIFPGSKGTCKNASLLSDAQVADILIKMGQ